MNYNNMNGDISHLRDTFLSAEREYALELLSHESVLETVLSLNENYTPEALFLAAQRKIDDIENGLVKEEDLELEEGSIVLLLSAVHDKELIKVLEGVRTRELKADK